MRDRNTLEPFPREARITAKVVGAGLGSGVFFYPGGCDPARDVVVLGPPFVIEEPELDLIAEVLEASIDSAVARALD